MPSGLVAPNDPPLPEVERRAAVLRDLLRQSGWKVTAEVADAALAHLGMPRSTLFRAVARFRRTRRASSLLPLKRGTRDGSSQVGLRRTNEGRGPWRRRLPRAPGRFVAERPNAIWQIDHTLV